MGKRARELAETIYSREIINKKYNMILKNTLLNEKSIPNISNWS